MMLLRFFLLIVSAVSLSSMAFGESRDDGGSGVGPVEYRMLPTGDARQLAKAIIAARERDRPRQGSSTSQSIGELEAAIDAAAKSAPVLQASKSANGAMKVMTAEGMPEQAFTTSSFLDFGRDPLVHGRRAQPHLQTDDGEKQSIRAHPQGECNLRVTELPQAWNQQEFMLYGQKVAETPDVVAVTYFHALSVIQRQYKLANDYAWYSPAFRNEGLQIIRLSMLTGQVMWACGNGLNGFTDGTRDVATFSTKITGIAIQPVCSKEEILYGRCASVARQGFFNFNRWMYVADSGNCAIRLVDIDTGRVRTKWGQSGCLTTFTGPSDLQDSQYADKVVLGSNLAVEWVGWKFLLVLDTDAQRIRKFVTYQHQGLSNLAGGFPDDACASGSGIDGPGDEATFCRPASIAASADTSMAVVSEYVGVDDTTIGRIRLLRFTYSYSPGGDVSDVTATVSTLSHAPYLSNSYLFTDFGGLGVTPASGVVGAAMTGTLLAGSFERDAVSMLNQVGDFSTGFPLVATSIPSNQVKLLTGPDGVPLSGRTLIDVAPHPTDAGFLQIVLAKHELVPYTEPDYTNILITFQVPKTSLVLLRVNATAFDVTCAQALAYNLLATPSSSRAPAQQQVLSAPRMPTHVGVLDQEGRVRVVSLADVTGLA